MEKARRPRHFLSVSDEHSRWVIWRRRTWAAWVALAKGSGRHRRPEAP
jgi:hypothetical protein